MRQHISTMSDHETKIERLDDYMERNGHTYGETETHKGSRHFSLRIEKGSKRVFLSQQSLLLLGSGAEK